MCPRPPPKPHPCTPLDTFNPMLPPSFVVKSPMTTGQQDPTPTTDPNDFPRIVGVLQEGQRQIEARLGGIEQSQHETNHRFDENQRENSRRFDENQRETSRRFDETNLRIDENQRETNRRFDETNHRIDRVLYALIAVGTVVVGGLIANVIVA